MPVPCSHCGRRRTVFVRRQENTDKYVCRTCRKTTIVPIGHSPVPERVAGPACIDDNTGCDGRSLDGKTGFMCFNHQNKAAKFLDALNHGGKYVLLDCARQYRGVKFCLTDTDILGRRNKLEHMQRSGVKRFFVYPHAARPNITNDIYPEWVFTTAHFVVTETHAEVMRRFGYSRPLVPVGWSLCPQRDFKPRAEAHKILFAPIHPRCSEVDQNVNREVFKRLEGLAKAGDIHLTVRFVRSLPESGLERVEHPNIEYTVGAMSQAYTDIDNADVVIAHQTFKYLAVARGVPTIAMATGMPTHIQMIRHPVQWAKNWDAYSDLMRFPYDLLDCPDRNSILNMLCAVIQENDAVADWRRRMIGTQFRKDRFIEKLEAFL
jgi:hypothetical protein